MATGIAEPELLPLHFKVFIQSSISRSKTRQETRACRP